MAGLAATKEILPIFAPVLLRDKEMFFLPACKYKCLTQSPKTLKPD